MRVFLHAALAVWGLSLAAGPVSAAQTIERTAYVVGPAGDQADRVIEILAGRMDRLGLHPTITTDGETIRVEVDAGYSTGYELDLVTFRALPRIYDNPEVVRQCPKNPTRVCIGTPNNPEIGGLLSVYKIAPLGGDIIEDVRLGEDRGIATLTLRFKAEAARKFGELTSRNVGKRLVLVADDVLLSAPVVREPILGGTALITGDVEYMEAWAIMLSQPPLPYALKFVRQEAAEPLVRGRRKRR